MPFVLLMLKLAIFSTYIDVASQLLTYTAVYNCTQSSKIMYKLSVTLENLR